jgi:hypothetical protein
MGFNLKNIGAVTLFTLFLANSYLCLAQEVSGYQKPPKDMVDIVEAFTTKSVIVSGTGEYMLILETAGYPPIAQISRPYLKLAGLRFNAQNHSNSASNYYASISVKNTRSYDEFGFDGIPKDAKIKDVSFSPGEKAIAFSITTENEVQLWIGDLASKTAKRLSNVALNDIYGTLYTWAADGNTILAKCVLEQKPLQALSAVENGPNVIQSTGRTSVNRTYQNLLKNANDEATFEYYLTSQLKMIYLNGQAVNYNRPEIYKSFDFSPDGELVMLSIIQKPYSHLVPISYFSHKVELRDKYGKLTRELATVPLADNLPQGFDAVVQGPREFAWRADKPQTVFFVEAQDDGDPNKRAIIRDILYTQEAGSVIRKKLADCYLRFNHIDWGDDQIALVNERWFKTRGERRVFIKPGNSSYRVNLWDRYYEDAYSDPGEFVKTKNQFNREVLLLEYNVIRRAADPNTVNIFSL